MDSSTSITNLRHEWHKAAVDGDAEAFSSFQGPLDCLLTPNQNTLLHVHLAIPNSIFRSIGFFPHFSIDFMCNQATNLRSTKFVYQILNKCPSLLKKPNAKGEIPLHVAARFGHSNIVQLLIKTAEAQEKDIENGIDPAKQMVRLTDNEGDTAMHQAVRYGHVDVVRELLDADPEFSYSVNRSHETPLYIAARRGYDSLVAMILDKSDAADHQGPCGRTALHAAAMAGGTGNQWGFLVKWTTREILRKRKDLVKARDENGQTPLHYAAHLGLTGIVKLLMECDESAAYEIDKDKMTALHIAARQGHSQVMLEIIDYCPGCCEIVDKRGWNFLHLAVVSFIPLETLAQKFLRADRFRRFVHEKDIHGNTPLQLLAASRQLHTAIAHTLNDDSVMIKLENLDFKKKEKILELLKEVGDGEVAGLSVKTIRQEKIDEERFDKARETQAVVAALIATVAFAAGFTLPGGYKSDESDKDRGSAILSHESDFGAFVIADSVAMISALLAINFNYLSARPMVTGARRTYNIITFNLMVWFGLLAEAALVVAFICGLYAVLKPALTLAITTCIIILCFFIAYFWPARRLYFLH